MCKQRRRYELTLWMKEQIPSDWLICISIVGTNIFSSGDKILKLTEERKWFQTWSTLASTLIWNEFGFQLHSVISWFALWSVHWAFELKEILRAAAESIDWAATIVNGVNGWEEEERLGVWGGWGVSSLVIISSGYNCRKLRGDWGGVGLRLRSV